MVVDKAWGQDGCILIKFFFFIDKDKVQVNKNAKK